MKWKLIHLPSVFLPIQGSVRILLFVPFEACLRVSGLFFSASKTHSILVIIPSSVLFAILLQYLIYFNNSVDCFFFLKKNAFPCLIYNVKSMFAKGGGEGQPPFPIFTKSCTFQNVLKRKLSY